MEKILVSACLMGELVRYDGGSQFMDHPHLKRWQEEGRLVRVCPEVIGGLSTPRPPAEIQAATGAEVLAGNALVLTNGGEDVSANFVDGARKALALAQLEGVRLAILKARSPSCGNEFIYDGSYTRTQVPGMGVAAANLHQAGIKVFNENQIEEAAAYLASLTAS